jgi:hypothetical protein
MTFVSLSFLAAGAAAMAIPVILHLTMRGRPSRVVFPALRLVKQRKEVNRRKFRLRHFLLLAMRMLVLLLLGLAMARPVVKFSGSLGSREAPIAAAMVFDTSVRMDYLHENRTRLEEARQFGKWILPRLPRQSRVAVLTGRRAPAAYQVDLRAAEDRIERLSGTPGGRPVADSVDSALKLLEESELHRKELYVLTDLTEPGWPKDLAPRLAARIESQPDLGVYVIDVGREEASDAGIASIQLSGEVLPAKTPFRIEAELFRQGEEPETRQVELLLADPLEPNNPAKARKRGNQTIDFPAGNARRRAVFHLSGLEEGMHQGYVRFITQDPLPSDNRRWFTLQVQSPWRVLLAAPEPVDRHAVYVRQALEPRALRLSGEAPFQVTTIPMDQLTQEELGKYHAVLLLDPPPLPAGMWKKLGDYAARGNGLGIFLGRQATPLDAFASDSALALLAGEPVLQARASVEPFRIMPDDYQSPILSSFRSIQETVPWEALPIYRYWQLGELAEGTEVSASYNDGRPALLVRPVGRGTVLTMTTPVSDSPSGRPWNLLPVSDASWVFVVLVDGIARTLVGAGDLHFNYLTGQAAVIPLKEHPGLVSCVMTLPDGVEVRVTPQGETQRLVIPSTEQVGNYRLRAGGGRDRLDTGFSVNYPPEQFDLARISSERLGEFFGEDRYRPASRREEIEVGLSEQRVGRELFPIAALLLAFLLLGECVLGNRFYR